MQKNNIPEEVTITPVIRDLEKLVNRILGLFISIFIWIGQVLANLFSIIRKHFIKLLLIGFLGGIIGVTSILILPRNYESNMIVKLNIDGSSQLFADVEYFNALAKQNQNDKLAEIFNIAPELANSIIDLQVKAYSPYYERVQIVNDIYISLDSVMQKYFRFNELLETENLSLSTRFIITVSSTDKSVFAQIEKGLISYLERVPELNELINTKKEQLNFERKVLLKQMENLDSLKLVLNEVMLEQSKSKNGSNSGSTITLGKSETQSIINPLEVYNQYNKYAKEVLRIDNEITKYLMCYTINTHFSEFGSKAGFGKFIRGGVLALLSILIAVIFLSFKGDRNKNN